MEPIPASIFRAYDIRGIVGDTLRPAWVELIGRAIGSEAAARGEATVIVARDGRLSGEEMCAALVRGLRAAGRDVIDIGMVPTPTLYFAAKTLEGTDSGVMVTGSHNPADYNGFKTVLAGESLSGEAITALYQRILDSDFVAAEDAGGYRQLDVREAYLSRILDDVKPARPLRVAIDCGNGVTGELAPQLFERLGCELTSLYTEIDGTFPNHHPDPGKPENLEDLIRCVKEGRADLGLAFDGDGDRVGVITSSGALIYPDRLMMAFAEDLLSRNPGARILFDVKCTGNLAKVIEGAGGVPEMYRTGHSLIKARMKESGALLAGEMSGHIFFTERWLGFDDGLYAAARLVEVLASQDLDADAFFERYPQDVSTPEVNVSVTDESKFAIIARLTEGDFGGGTLNTLDGVRVDYDDGWGLCRASNTSPVLVLRFEGKDASAMSRIRERFVANLTEAMGEAPALSAH
ncbi:phosphomannomutase/phosphoglucomutase [Halomonas maura]|uniref:phosphomannomutase/phosphoglucomutase n=1 Tax=Halomonas maura TaxID=117606 RepID=UPI0025B540D7|nr:phosphomannomutase/phosphoglucomutase [Halomonas maura]MDN3554945.1 phosphomannomutase/phosphoglucomutase [Halomonas maura]